MTSVATISVSNALWVNVPASHGLVGQSSEVRRPRAAARCPLIPPLSPSHSEPGQLLSASSAAPVHGEPHQVPSTRGSPHFHRVLPSTRRGVSASLHRP